jgi:hypothetical protein
MDLCSRNSNCNNKIIFLIVFLIIKLEILFFTKARQKMQKKIIALLFVFILFNCKNGETKKEFLITNTKEHELFLNKDRTININISEDVYYYSFLITLLI